MLLEVGKLDELDFNILKSERSCCLQGYFFQGAWDIAPWENKVGPVSLIHLHALPFLHHKTSWRRGWVFLQLAAFSMCTEEKIVFLFRATARLEMARQVGVCLHSENLFSWSGIKHSTHTHTHKYTRSITLTPDARKWSGDRVASTAKPRHA